jgi:hypothetical protein
MFGIDTTHTLYVSATAAVGSFGLYGNQNVNLFGMGMPSPVVSGIAVGLANGLIQWIDTKYPLTSEVPIPEAWRSEASMLTVPALTGVSTYFVARGLGLSDQFLPNFALGAGSELVGGYAGSKMKSAASTGTL